MRPLTVEPLAGLPSFVLGVAVIRGSPTPVLDVRRLFSTANSDDAAGRWVALRLGMRAIALAVDGVIGVRRIASDQRQALPALLRDVPTEYIETIGTLDSELLVVLRTGRMLPETVWAQLAPGVAEAR